MTELERIINMEINFPRIFTNVSERDYGVIFYNTDIPESHDSNHAVILDSNQFEYAVKDIKEFYTSRKLTPRLYSSFQDSLSGDMIEVLTSNGFEISDVQITEYLILKGESKIKEKPTLEFKKFTAGSDYAVFEQILDEEDWAFSKDVISRRIQSDDYTLIIGYEGESPVVMASIQFDEYGTGRLDDVNTAQKHRGKGYARQITAYIVDYFRRSKGKLFYTWAANDTAQRIYIEGGFVLSYSLPFYRAEYKCID